MFLRFIYYFLSYRLFGILFSTFHIFKSDFQNYPNCVIQSPLSELRTTVRSSEVYLELPSITLPRSSLMEYIFVIPAIVGYMGTCLVLGSNAGDVSRICDEC